MKSTENILYIIAVVSIFLISSCKTTYHTGGNIIENIKPAKLYENIIKNELYYDDLSLKFSAEVLIEEKKESLGGIIRIKKDSIIWVSIRVLNIEGARLVFTQDSVKFINRLENTYFSENLKTFTKKNRMNIDYNIIQSILTNNFFFYPNSEQDNISSFKQCIDTFYYCMSSISRRKYEKFYSEENPPARWERRLEKEIKGASEEYGNNNFVFQTIKIIPEIFKIRSINIENYVNQQQSLSIEYDKFVLEDNQYFPKLMEFWLPYFDISLKLNIENISINPKSISFPFKITNKYQEIVFP